MLVLEMDLKKEEALQPLLSKTLSVFSFKPPKENIGCTLPSLFNISKVTLTSDISGTLYNFILFLFKIHAAKIGREAFLEPDIVTLPSNLLPPFIIIFFINLLS